MGDGEVFWELKVGIRDREGSVDGRKVGDGCGASCFCVNVHGRSVLEMGVVGREEGSHGVNI